MSSPQTAHLRKEYRGDEFAALCHERASELEVYPDRRGQVEALRENGEIGRKIRNGMHLGNIVIHTESAAHIHVGDAEPLLGKPPVGSIDLPTELREDPQVGYLGTDMEMQSHDVDVAQVAQHSHHIRYLPGRDSELVLRKARSNITVGVGVDVGIYPQRHVGDHAEFPCKRIYHDKFVFRFAVKGEYTLPQRIDYLAVLFPHTGIDDVLRGEARLYGPAHLVAAHAVGPHAARSDELHDTAVVVGLHGIVQPISVTVGLTQRTLHRPTQQLHVVQIKGSLILPESLLYLPTQHPFRTVCR